MFSYVQIIIQYIRTFTRNDISALSISCVVVFFIFVILAKTLSILLCRIVRPFVKKKEGYRDDKLLETFEKSSYRLLIILGAYLALGYFQTGIDSFPYYTNRRLEADYKGLINTGQYIGDILYIILVIESSIIIAKVISHFLDWYGERIDAGENKDLSGSLFPLLNKIARLALACGALIIILTKFKVDITAFVLSLGVGSLAIALAAQDTLSNMISGFIIMTDRPFRIGDRIKIGNDIFGDVAAIGIRSTKILDFDKNIIILPNNDVVKSRIINLTYPATSTRIVVEVQLPYGIDTEIIKNKLIAIAKEEPALDPDTPPEALMVKFGENGLDFRLTARILDYTKAFDISCGLREKIYKRFIAEGIEFSYSRRVIQIDNKSFQNLNV